MNQSDRAPVEVNLLELKLFDECLDDRFTPQRAMAGPLEGDGPAIVAHSSS
jgi:hypothetical protein